MAGEVDEANYYRRREQDQRQFADKAKSQTIRNLHLDIADRYRQLAQEAEFKLTGQDQVSPSSDDAAA